MLPRGLPPKLKPVLGKMSDALQVAIQKEAEARAMTALAYRVFKHNLRDSILPSITVNLVKTLRQKEVGSARRTFIPGKETLVVGIKDRLDINQSKARDVMSWEVDDIKVRTYQTQAYPEPYSQAYQELIKCSESCQSDITRTVKDPQTIPTSSTLYEKVKLSIKEVPIKSVLALRMFSISSYIVSTGKPTRISLSRDHPT